MGKCEILRGVETRVKPNRYRVRAAIGCKVNMEQELDVARLSINPVPGRKIIYLSFCLIVLVLCKLSNKTKLKSNPL